MQTTLGLFLIVLAGCLQGLFVLPLTFTRRWQWEHSWAAFSLFGMLLFNWLIAAVLLPHTFAAYQNVPAAELLTVAAFGAGWGIGAILFGLGMDKLGMALGYPVIMGLIASLGALVPLLLRNPAEIATFKGVVLLVGMVIVVAGIVFCSQASALKGQPSRTAAAAAAGTGGLLIAIGAGTLSCLPNVGMNYAQGLTRAAVTAGTTPTMAGDVRLGAPVHGGVRYERCLLHLAYGAPWQCVRSVAQRTGAERSLVRAGGGAVDWQLLSIRIGRGQTGGLGRHRGLAVLHLPGHRGWQYRRAVARRMDRRSKNRPRQVELRACVAGAGCGGNSTQQHCEDTLIEVKNEEPVRGVPPDCLPL